MFALRYLSSLHYYPTYLHILIRKDIFCDGSGLLATSYLCVACVSCVALLLSVSVGSVLIALCISGGVSTLKGISHCEIKINQLISYKKKKGSATSAAFEAHPSWQVCRQVSVRIWLSA